MDPIAVSWPSNSVGLPLLNTANNELNLNFQSRVNEDDFYFRIKSLASMNFGLHL